MTYRGLTGHVAVAAALALAVTVAGGRAAADGAEGESPEGAPDPWTPLHSLLGRWEGEGASFGKPTRVSHTYERVIHDKFVRLSTRSSRLDGTDEHEDVGFFSWDPARETIVLRQFLSEGFVNTYLAELSADGATMVLTTESTEGAGGTHARLTYAWANADEYTATLELAPPGKDWFSCQTMTMKRVE